jgi:hypothetical protein
VLGVHPIHSALLATDLAVAKDFHQSRPGLEILSEGDDRRRYRPHRLRPGSVDIDARNGVLGILQIKR